MTKPLRNRIAFRRKFLARAGSLESFQQLFNQLPGVYFSVKDVHSRLIWGNQALFQRLNVSEDEIIGTTDYQYFPRHIAAGFIRDDQAVIRTGQPIVNRIAVWYNDQRMLDWFVKNKFPLRDGQGKIIGLIVTLQNYDGVKHAQSPFSDLHRSIEYIRRHPHERVSVKALAAASGVSSRQLHRRFRHALGLSVHQFLVKTRIQGAIDALINTSLPIAEIALQFGFSDQSSFTRVFRANTAFTPKTFRRQHSITPATDGSF